MNDSTYPLSPSPPPPHRFFPPHRSSSRISSFFRSCFGSLCGPHRSLDWDDFLCCNPPPSSKDDDAFAASASDVRTTSSWHDRWGFFGSRRMMTAHPSVSASASAGAGGWAQEQLLDSYEDHYVRPPGWKRFLRKLRSETRKMNCSKPSPSGFQYDPLSYAMNFDDGAWQQPQQQQQQQAFMQPSMSSTVETSPLKPSDHGLYDSSYGRI